MAYSYILEFWNKMAHSRFFIPITDDQYCYGSGSAIGTTGSDNLVLRPCLKFEGIGCEWRFRQLVHKFISVFFNLYSANITFSLEYAIIIFAVFVDAVDGEIYGVHENAKQETCSWAI